MVGGGDPHLSGRGERSGCVVGVHLELEECRRIDLVGHRGVGRHRRDQRSCGQPADVDHRRGGRRAQQDDVGPGGGLLGRPGRQDTVGPSGPTTSPAVIEGDHTRTSGSRGPPVRAGGAPGPPAPTRSLPGWTRRHEPAGRRPPPWSRRSARPSAPRRRRAPQAPPSGGHQEGPCGHDRLAFRLGQVGRHLDGVHPVSANTAW